MSSFFLLALSFFIILTNNDILRSFAGDVVKSINAISANVKHFRNSAAINYSKNQASIFMPEYALFRAYQRSICVFCKQRCGFFNTTWIRTAMQSVYTVDHLLLHVVPVGATSRRDPVQTCPVA